MVIGLTLSISYPVRPIQITSRPPHMKQNKFSLNKEICAGLNLRVIIVKFLQILDNYVTCNLWKFQIDSSKIEASTNFCI